MEVLVKPQRKTQPVLRVTTAFEGHYFIGLLVSIYSLRGISISEGFNINLEIAVDKSQIDGSLVQLVSVALEDMGLSFAFVPVDVNGDRIRYVSRISKVKIDMLESSKLPFLWLDADTICLPRGVNFFHGLVGFDSPAAVPRDGDIRNFNSGVFWSGTMRVPFERAYFPKSELYSDQHVLQFVLKDHIDSLPLSYNKTVTWGGIAGLVDESNVLHFTGEYKPWMVPWGSEDRCLGRECDFSPWFDIEKQMIEEFSPASWVEDYLASRQQILTTQLRFTSLITRFLRYCIRFRLFVSFVSWSIKLLAFCLPAGRTREVLRYSLHPYH